MDVVDIGMRENMEGWSRDYNLCRRNLKIRKRRVIIEEAFQRKD